jgi:hypothetical protein
MAVDGLRDRTRVVRIGRSRAGDDEPRARVSAGGERAHELEDSLARDDRSEEEDGVRSALRRLEWEAIASGARDHDVVPSESLLRRLARDDDAIRAAQRESLGGARREARAPSELGLPRREVVHEEDAPRPTHERKRDGDLAVAELVADDDVRARASDAHRERDAGPETRLRIEREHVHLVAGGAQTFDDDAVVDRSARQ